MDDLDFSGLTDDQLVALARSCCIEAIRRSPWVSNAMLDMMRAEATKARQKAELATNRHQILLAQAAELLGRSPAQISILYAHIKGSRRVYINEGCYRYSRHHLVEYDAERATISVVAALRDHQLDLIEFCAGLTALVPLDTHITP